MSPSVEPVSNVEPQVVQVTVQWTYSGWIPCFILFKDGQVVKQTVGGMPKEALLENFGL